MADDVSNKEEIEDERAKKKQNLLSGDQPLIDPKDDRLAAERKAEQMQCKSVSICG